LPKTRGKKKKGSGTGKGGKRGIQGSRLSKEHTTLVKDSKGSPDSTSEGDRRGGLCRPKKGGGSGPADGRGEGRGERRTDRANDTSPGAVGRITGLLAMVKVPKKGRNE